MLICSSRVADYTPRSACDFCDKAAAVVLFFSLLLIAHVNSADLGQNLRRAEQAVPPCLLVGAGAGAGLDLLVLIF